MATDDSRPKSLPVNVLRGVAWKTYQQLRDHPSNGHLRMSSLDGTLTLMSPEFIHDRYGRRLSIVIDQVTEAWQVLVQGTATTTLRRKGEGRRKGSAKEPDYGFYYGENALRMNNRAELDLDVDPPPDLVIEGDYKSDTAKALKLYSRLASLKFGDTSRRTISFWFGRLSGDSYDTIERSLNLPRLTPSLVLIALAKIGELSETPAKPWLRDWARGLRDPAL